MNTFFKGLFDSETLAVITPGQFLLCIAVALVIGAFLAAVYSYKTKHTQSFVITLAFLPAIVCMVILMVNGNVGASVAVAGAFSLVRFRSVPGTAKEIGVIFLAMAAGLACGMGYLAYAGLFSFILGLLLLFTNRIMDRKAETQENILRITIPEDLNYNTVFDEVFENYTTKCELISAKTTNLGSMYKLTYQVILADPQKEKEMIDELRCRNGNLEIMISRQEVNELAL